MRTAVQAAAKNDHVTIVHILLEREADVNVCNAKRETAVARAANEDNILMIMLLLERDAKVHLANTIESSLSYAAAHAGEKTVKLLLELDVHFEINSINALMIAIHRGKEDIVRIILHHAVDFDHALARSIVKAAEIDHNEMINLLLTHDVDINSIIEFERLGSFYISELFLNAKQMITPLSETTRLNQRSTMKLLLDRETKPNVNDDQALQSCIEVFDTSLSSMKLLLKYGVDVDTTREKHESALNATCSKNRINIVRRLLNLKTNINAPISRLISSLINSKSLMYISQTTSTEAHFM